MDARLPGNPDRLQDARIAALEARIEVVEAMVRPSALREAAVAPRRASSIRAIVEATAAEFRVTPDDILSPRRRQPQALARQVVCHLARRLTAHSYPAIGRALKRDHTTIYHADHQVAARCAADPELAARVEALAAALTTPQPEGEQPACGA